MKSLNVHSYVGVLLKKVRSENLLFYPLVRESVSQTIKLLQNPNWDFSKKRSIHPLLKAMPTSKTYVQNSFDLAELCYKSVSAPDTLLREEYESWFRDKSLAITELFHPSWKLDHLGSSRNYLAGDFQIKGSGKSLPSRDFWQPTHSGLLDLDGAIQSFINSHLADTTLPLGSVRGVGVVRNLDDENAGFYIREARGPRLAQLSPDGNFDRESMLKDLQRFFQTSDPRLWLKQITFQLASMAYLGVTFQGSPDNINIFGQPLDEEEWIWPRSQVNYTFSLEVCDGKIQNSSSRIYRKLLRNFHRAFGMIFGSGEIPAEEDLRNDFDQYLQALSPNHSIKDLWEKVSAENYHEFDHDSRPILGADALSIVIRIPRRIAYPSETFNTFERSDLSTYGKRLAAHASAGLLNASEASSSLLKLIGHSGYVVPLRLTREGALDENILTWARYQEEHLKHLPVTPDLIELWKDGETIQTKFEELESLNLIEFIPLSLNAGSSWMPLKKCIVRMRT